MHRRLRLAFASHHQIALTQPQGQLDGLGQAGPDSRSGHQAVDHDLDVVPHLAVEVQVLGKMHYPAVYPGAHEALLQQVLAQVAILALLTAD